MDDYDSTDLKVISKKSLLRRFIDFWAGLKKEHRKLTFSRFYYFVENLDKKNSEYKDAITAVRLCDDAISIIGQRISVIEQIKELNGQLLELSCYEKIGESDAKNFKEIMARLKALNKDRNDLKNQIAGLDPALARLVELEKDAEEIVPEIKDAEQNQRAFKHDMNYLQGEKTELEYERDKLNKGIIFIKKFMMGVIIIFIICVIILGFSAAANGNIVAVPLTVMTLLAIIITALLYGFHIRIKYELDINLKKQQKAVEMLNRKSAVFVHYTNFLNYTYNKYKVRNAEMLKRHLQEYERYKYLTRRFDAIRKMTEETEKEINTFLKKYDISTMSLTLENFAKVFNLDEKIDIYKTSLNKKNSMEKYLRNLDDRQERLWDELVLLNKTEGGVVEKIINSYIEEASKVILRPAKSVKEGAFEGKDKGAAGEISSVREVLERVEKSEKFSENDDSVSIKEFYKRSAKVDKNDFFVDMGKKSKPSEDDEVVRDYRLVGPPANKKGKKNKYKIYLDNDEEDI